MYSVPFVCLFVSKIMENYWPNFHETRWKGVAKHSFLEQIQLLDKNDFSLIYDIHNLGWDYTQLSPWLSQANMEVAGPKWWRLAVLC